MQTVVAGGSMRGGVVCDVRSGQREGINFVKESVRVPERVTNRLFRAVEVWREAEPKFARSESGPEVGKGRRGKCPKRSGGARTLLLFPLDA